MSSDLPTVITKAGLQPIPPATLLTQLLAAVAAVTPGYTANLPGSLIEDISSTDVAALAQCDSSRIDLVNSLTPFASNDFLLAQLGEMLGIKIGAASNTSVFVVFSGTVGFVIAQGFTASDGTFQYIVQDGGVIGSGGVSQPLFAVATQTGSWAVASGTVIQLITSVPSTITLTVNNPLAGIPSSSAETAESYRARVLQANLAASQGMARYLKTLLANVPGVQPRLVSVLQQTDGWEVICGGGDPYAVAYAIFTALFDFSSLVPSEIKVLGVTVANPGVVTTDLNHGFINGQAVTILGSLPTNYNGVWTVTVITETTFSIGNTTGFPAYVSGGVCLPNPRNIAVSLVDYPDVYVITFVSPPQQSVTMTVTWNTTATNVVSPVAVAQLGAPALADYVNAVAVGQPMNLFELQEVFQQSIESLIPRSLLTRMVFAVSINGVGTSPLSGTGIIAGDPESYFFALDTGIVIVQG